MRKSFVAIAVLLATAFLSSCGSTSGNSALSTLAGVAAQSYLSGNNSTSTSTNSNTTSNVLSSLVSGATSSTGSSLLGSIIGAFTSTTNSNTIVGTWTYQQPSIQFESSNLLAQAGGALASNSIVSKITPYYEKVGLKAGVAQLTFGSDNTCSIVLSSKTISGTYSLDSSAGKITVTSSLGIKLFTAYVSVSGSQLSLTMDSSNLLSMIQNMGSNSSNSTLSGISSLASSFSGMKTGFLFTK